MSTKARVYAVPSGAFDSAAALATEIANALAGPRGSWEIRVDGEAYAAIAAPSPKSDAWTFTLRSPTDDEAHRLTVSTALGQHPAFQTLTFLHHNDQVGVYWFEHATPGKPTKRRPSGRTSFRLGSTGPYLCGDAKAITIDYPQKGYTHKQLIKLNQKAAAKGKLTAKDERAVDEYMSAVAIGAAMFYPGGLRYMKVLYAEEGWLVWDRGRHLGSAPAAKLADDWSFCLDRDLPDELESLDAWVADA
jgi:hypothetical protein